MNPILLGGVLDIGKTLIAKLIKDPEAKARAEMELIQLHQQGEIKELEVRLSAVLAEAQSNDAWTSRARPSFLYVIYIMILASIPMGIVYAVSPDTAGNIAEGMRQWLGAIPGELYTLFGAGYLGYAHYRSGDKMAVK